MEECSNSIPVFPTGILIEVLCRLPLKTLVRLCCVCKFWKDLILSDRSFIRCHLKQSLKKSSNVLMYSDWFGNDMGNNPVLAVLGFINADEKCLRKSFYLGTDFSLVGCINGVFCLHEYLGSYNRLYLWNPALHQCRILPHYSTTHFKFFEVLGFGYDRINDDYVVVKIDKASVNVYQLRRNYWTKIEFPLHPSGDRVSCSNMVAVVHDGALHWLSYNSEGEKEIFLNVYNLRAKRFQEILVSGHIPFDCYSTYLGWMRGCLCVLGRSAREHKYEVWVTDKYGVENSWTKKFEFPSNIIPRSYQSGFRTSGKFLVEFKDHSALYCPQSEEIEFVEDQAKIYFLGFYFFTDNYVASLVSVFPPAPQIANCSSFLKDGWLAKF